MAGKKNLDDRQIRFLAAYLDPKSDTYSDAKNSALAVGYKEQYANSITALAPEWLSDAIGRRKRLLERAERNTEEVLGLDVYQDAIGPFGPVINKETGKPYQTLSAKVLMARGDASKFVMETVGKETYSKKGQGGNTVLIQINTSPALVERYAPHPNTGDSSEKPA